MKIEDIRKVTVLGAGTMGHGIAQLAAASGYTVVLRDISQEILDNALKNIRGSLERLVQRGRLSENDLKSTLSRISTATDLKEAAREADIIIEAVPENIDLKLRIFKEADNCAPKEAVFTSNTSSLSITDIAESVTNPRRFVGMHFFNPPAVMRLVEIVPGKKTSGEALETATAFAARLGKTPVNVKKDSPGFIVNRILITYINEAAKVVSRGDSKIVEIDSGMQYKAKFPMGPFLLSDLIGIDIVYSVLKVFESKLGSFYKASPPIERLYQAQKLGRKTGEGFYVYKEGNPKIPEEAGARFETKNLFALMLNEASKLVLEEVAEQSDIDTAMKLGANLPEGPFEAAKRLGTRSLIDSLKETEQKLGKAYAPTSLLLQMAQ